MSFVRCLVLVVAVPLLVAPAAAEREVPRHWGRDRLVDLEHLRIGLRIDLEEGHIEGTTGLRVRALVDGTASAELDAVDFEVASVTVDGRQVDAPEDGRVLTVPFDPPLAAGQVAQVEVTYSATPRAGLYFVRPDRAHPQVQLQCWSQGETEDNRHWFPSIDAPAERATSETLIRVAAPLRVVSNGPLLGVEEHGDGTRTWHHRLDFQHAPYLVSIAVGDWAVVEDRWEDVELGYFGPRARAADLRRSFEKTPAMLGFLSDFIGVRYPYPVYWQTAVTHFMWGGMENITATTVTDQTLHDARAHSDWPSESLVAHELAHQWFGDYVTCADWSDAWLNEGFATYYAALTLGHLEGQDRLVVELDRMRQSAVEGDAGDARRPIVTNRYREEFELFDSHAYSKGGMVLHALRRELGDAAYRQAIHAYLQANAGRSVTTHDLVAAIEQATGRDVSRFFDQWVFRAGQPDLVARWRWKDGAVTLEVEQTQPQGDLVGDFDVPLDVQVLGSGPPVERQVRLDDRNESFRIESSERPKAVLIDPQGWLLRTLDWERSDREATWVLRNAKDLLPRLEAARELKDSAGQRDVERALVGTLANASEWALRREAALSLSRSTGALARGGLLDALGSEPDSRVRAAVAKSLGEMGEQVAPVLRKALESDDSYAVRAAAALALAGIEAPDAAQVLERALSQPSHRDEVFKGALTGLKEIEAPRALLLAEKWTARGTRLPARNHAVALLAEIAARSDDEGDRRRVREHLVDLLDDGLFTTRQSAIGALGTLGDAEALPELRRIAASAPEGRLRKAARDAIEAIEKKSAQAAKLTDFARRLDEERKAREKLEKKVRSLESRMVELGGGEDDEEEAEDAEEQPEIH